VSPFWSRPTRPDPSQPVPAAPAGPASPATGPLDAADPAAPAEGMLDLGALRLVARPEVKVRLDVDKASQRVAAVTVQAEASNVQLTAFAAPRSGGVWDEVRPEIAAAVKAGGGTVEERDGSFGTELVARVPAALPDGRKVLQVQRFCGVDGPRWFVRAVFSGPEVLQSVGATIPDDLASRGRGDLLEEVVRTAVVVRGGDPMAPREPLPLRVPEGARPAARAQAAPAAEQPGEEPGDSSDAAPGQS
jgi:hypothetical protein